MEDHAVYFVLYIAFSAPKFIMDISSYQYKLYGIPYIDEWGYTLTISLLIFDFFLIL